MPTANYDILLTILSIGFIILILFVCVALGAMIRIMIDIKKITELAKKQSEKVDEALDVVSEKAKSFFTNAVVLEKVIPSILGAISVGVGAKKVMDHYDSKTKVKKGKSES